MTAPSPQVSNLSILWIKVLVAGALGVTFSLFGVIAVWLLAQKIGHRVLLMLQVAFFFTFAYSQFEIATNIYFHGVNFALLWRGVSAALGIALALYAWQQKFNICATLERSESKDIERKIGETDTAADKEMAHQFTVKALDMCTNEARALRGKQDELLFQRG